MIEPHVVRRIGGEWTTRFSTIVAALFAALAMAMSTSSAYAACSSEGRRACCAGEREIGEYMNGLEKSTA